MSVRGFVAVAVEPARESLVELARELAAEAPEVRWIAPEQLHLTLKFLGNIETSRIGYVAAAVRAAVASRRAFEVEIAGVGGFPDARRPSVVWAGVRSGTRELAALAGAVARAVEPLGFPLDERAYKAHVTLARIRERLAAPAERALAAALEKRAARPVARLRVGSVELMESRLSPSGPTYVPLETFGLEAA